MNNSTEIIEVYKRWDKILKKIPERYQEILVSVKKIVAYKTIICVFNKDDTFKYLAIDSESFKTKFQELIKYVRIDAVIECSDEIDDIKEIFILEIEESFGDCPWIRKIKNFNTNTVEVLLYDVMTYVRDNNLWSKYCNMVRNINLKLKSKNIDLFLRKRYYDKFGYTHEEIVEDGFVPLDIKLQCNKCELKCTDNDIDINKELTYIKTNYREATKKESYQISAWCLGGEKIKGLKLTKTIKKRNNHTLSMWAEYIKNRDEHRCIFCKCKENLHAHHVIPVSNNKRYMYDTGNGITLCEECHKRMHRMLKNIEPSPSLYRAFNINNLIESEKEV